MDVESADVEVELPTAKAVRRYQNLPRQSPNPARTSRVPNPGAPDMKRFKRPSSEVKAALERKKEHRIRLKMQENAKIEAMAAMEINDMLSNSLDSEEGDAAAATDIDDSLEYFLGNEEAGTSIEVEPEGEDEDKEEEEDKDEDEDEDDDDDDGVITIVTASTKASTKDTLAKKNIVSQSLVGFMKRADKVAQKTKRPAKGEVRAAVDAVREEIKAGQKRHSVAESAESGLCAR
jgi:hypothetical protein